MNVLEKILEEIKDLKEKQNSSNQDYATGYFSALSTVEGIISGVKENDGWIPVEERLPEVPKELEDAYCPEFNVMIKEAEIATTLKYSWDGTWFDDIGEVYDVVAWQPLPEPYIPPIISKQAQDLRDRESFFMEER